MVACTDSGEVCAEARRPLVRVSQSAEANIWNMEEELSYDDQLDLHIAKIEEALRVAEQTIKALKAENDELRAMIERAINPAQ